MRLEPYVWNVTGPIVANGEMYPSERGGSWLFCDWIKVEDAETGQVRQFDRVDIGPEVRAAVEPGMSGEWVFFGSKQRVGLLEGRLDVARFSEVKAVRARNRQATRKVVLGAGGFTLVAFFAIANLDAFFVDVILLVMLALVAAAAAL